MARLGPSLQHKSAECNLGNKAEGQLRESASIHGTEMSSQDNMDMMVVLRMAEETIW